MKKSVVLFLLAVLVMPVFADFPGFSKIEEYDDFEKTMCSFKAERKNNSDWILFQFSSVCMIDVQENKGSVAWFYLVNSNWSDKTVKEFMRKVYYEKLRDEGHFVDQKIMRNILNYYIQDFLPKKNSGFFNTNQPYEFVLDDVTENGNITDYHYILKIQ